MFDWYEVESENDSHFYTVRRLEDDKQELERQIENLECDVAELEADVKFWQNTAKEFEEQAAEFADGRDEWRSIALRYEKLLRQHGINYEI